MAYLYKVLTSIACHVCMCNNYGKALKLSSSVETCKVYLCACMYGMCVCGTHLYIYGVRVYTCYLLFFIYKIIHVVEIPG